MAEGGLMAGAGAGELPHADVLQAPAARVLEPPRDEEIVPVPVPDEEAAARQAAAAASAVVTVEGRQPRAPGSLEVQGHGDPSRPPDLRTVSWADNWCTAFWALAHPKLSKWVYFIFFLGGIAMAMSSRDLELSSFTRRVNGYNQDRYLLAGESALRVSLAFFLFFTMMFMSTVWTKKIYECRNYWNSNLSGPMLVKIVMVPVCLFLAELPSSSFIQIYGNIARAGAWLFLVIQLISVTRMVMWLNTWQQLNPERRRWLLRAVTILSNFGSFGFIFWLLHQNRSNIVESVIATVTLVLMSIMLFVYLKSELTTGWLAPGLMLSYIAFMCWTVIKSGSHGESTKTKDTKGPDWLTIMSLGFVAYSTLGTGEDEWLQFNNEEESEVPPEDNIPYGFGYFHLVFALGSMYFGMILVGWNAHQSMQRWTIDFGWWSAVVRGANGLLAVVLYIWMLRTSFIWNKTKVVLSFHEASWVPQATFQ